MVITAAQILEWVAILILKLLFFLVIEILNLANNSLIYTIEVVGDEQESFEGLGKWQDNP